MTTQFADTFFWTALADPHDQWHSTVRQYDERAGARRIVTTDEVLVEFSTHFGVRGQPLRRLAAEWVRTILGDPDVEVVAQTRRSFLRGLALFENRPDKRYSLTDCISMETMRRLGIQQVLTHDRHFVQEGFDAVLR